MQPSLFARTIQQSQIWLKEMVDGGGIVDEHKAYAALRAVLHHLRDRLTVEEAAHLGDQMPTLIRGIYYEAWRPAITPTRDRSRDDFIAAVRYHLADHPEIRAEAAIDAVFELLNRHISAGEISHVVHMLPHHIRELWPKQPV